MVSSTSKSTVTTRLLVGCIHIVIIIIIMSSSLLSIKRVQGFVFVVPSPPYNFHHHRHHQSSTVTRSLIRSAYSITTTSSSHFLLSSQSSSSALSSSSSSCIGRRRCIHHDMIQQRQHRLQQQRHHILLSSSSSSSSLFSTFSETSTSTTNESDSSSLDQQQHDGISSSSSSKQKPPIQLLNLKQIQKQLPKVILKRNHQSKAFRYGSQLVFSGSISKVSSGSLKLGDLVQVEVPVADNSNKNKNKKNKNNDSKDNNKDNNQKQPKQPQQQQEQTQIIGWGVYNPDSMYRVRILCHSSLIDMQQFNTKLQQQQQQQIDSEGNNDNNDDNDDDDPSLLLLSTILDMQFTKALRTRKALGLPSIRTNTYRLINGEGDSISGLAVDIVGGQVGVVMSSAGWCEIHKSTILKCLKGILPPDDNDLDFVWRTTPSRLKQDGYDDDHVDVDDDEKESSQPIIALENGIQYETFPYQQDSQKTSVYCDQRENRYYIGSLLCNINDKENQKKRVLDLCCYHGGFSLNVAKMMGGGGYIEKVIGVDSSQDAIDICKTNAKLNGVDDITEFIKADIATYMQSSSDDENKFDIIILDPPKLAPNLNGLPKATRKYHSLNRDAMKLINEELGGLFMTCTCSAAMSQKDGGNYFLQTIQQASVSAKRQITLLKVNGAASCHTQSPISYPAGNYLTAALFFVHPK